MTKLEKAVVDAWLQWCPASHRVRPHGQWLPELRRLVPRARRLLGRPVDTVQLVQAGAQELSQVGGVAAAELRPSGTLGGMKGAAQQIVSAVRLSGVPFRGQLGGGLYSKDAG
jgi:hypothetical protein